MARLEFSRKTRRAIIERAAGRCENPKCGAILKKGEGEIDHILPSALGGKADQANGMLLCRVCHVEKSGHDIRRVRKADRQRDRNSGAMLPMRKIRSPGFAKKPARAPKPMPPVRSLYARGELAQPSTSQDQD